MNNRPLQKAVHCSPPALINNGAKRIYWRGISLENPVKRSNVVRVGEALITQQIVTYNILKPKRNIIPSLLRFHNRVCVVCQNMSHRVSRTESMCLTSTIIVCYLIYFPQIMWHAILFRNVIESNCVLSCSSLTHLLSSRALSFIIEYFEINELNRDLVEPERKRLQEIQRLLIQMCFLEKSKKFKGVLEYLKKIQKCHSSKRKEVSIWL